MPSLFFVVKIDKKTIKTMKNDKKRVFFFQKNASNIPF